MPRLPDHVDEEVQVLLRGRLVAALGAEVQLVGQGDLRGGVELDGTTAENHEESDHLAHISKTFDQFYWEVF